MGELMIIFGSAIVLGYLFKIIPALLTMGKDWQISLTLLASHKLVRVDINSKMKKIMSQKYEGVYSRSPLPVIKQVRARHGVLCL